ncbi:type II secretion system minor pseudopilin GspI [Pacificimonas sp. WHA3]|uniref:Type II secretion system protein I n=1 Tax=Pacificimonas pallii TaxID=2827236 RepID=A0ABS6SHC1_9SPHN|nr:type II secretion system minor pseudopilin GspI [Pacificimonas pallii]MBV7257814.1 type II secretion system minor pseudopilin GspI [Pacificimonas pallii]
MRAAETGFSLVEVMVALGILSLAMMALLRLNGASASTAVAAERAALADIAAENAMVEAMLLPRAPAFGTSTATIFNAGQNWTVTTEAERLGDGLIRLRVDVADGNGVAASLQGMRSAG